MVASKIFNALVALVVIGSTSHGVIVANAEESTCGTGTTNQPSMSDRLSFLKAQGFTPSVIVDGGAWHGEWSTLARHIFPNARLLALEANAACAPSLQKFESEIALLGDDDGKLVPYYSSRKDIMLTSTGNSIFLEQSPHFSNENLVVEHLQMKTLDTICEERGILSIDLLKLDVQGAELIVLDGGSHILKHTEFVLLEVSVLPYNKGAPLLAEVIAYMDKIGFQVFDVYEIHYYGGYALQTDFMFVKKGSKYIPTLAQEGGIRN